MPEPTTDELQEQFTAARVGGDYATMERIGRQLYPEPGEERVPPDAPSGFEKFRATLAEKYHIDVAKEDVAQGTRTLGPRAALAAVNAKLAKGHHTERVRQALLAKQEQAQRALFEATQTAASGIQVPSGPSKAQG